MGGFTAWLFFPNVLRCLSQKQSNKNKFCPRCGTDLDKAKRSDRVRYWIDYRYFNPKKNKIVQRREPVGTSISEARPAMGKRRSKKRETRFSHMLTESKLTFDELSKWYLNLTTVKKLHSCLRIKFTEKRFNGVFGNCSYK